MSEVRIEVVYAAGPEPDRQLIVTVTLPEGATVVEAMRAAHVTARFPEVDPATCAAGIFGERVASDRVLRDGERVEIYRPLMADVKEVLRQRTRTRRAPKPAGD